MLIDRQKYLIKTPCNVTWWWTSYSSVRCNERREKLKGTPLCNIQLEKWTYITGIWHQLVLIKFTSKFGFQCIFLFRYHITVTNSILQHSIRNVQLYRAGVWHRLILIKFIRKFDLYVSYQDIFLFRNEITLMNQ